MTTDPTLEALVAAGHYAIAADRYEEQTGDAELAALMRIDGLEWELVDGLPALRMKVVFIPDLIWGWELSCGSADFGDVVDNKGQEMRPKPLIPEKLEDTPIHRLLTDAGLGPQFAERFYCLYLETVPRVCIPEPS